MLGYTPGKPLRTCASPPAVPIGGLEVARPVPFLPVPQAVAEVGEHRVGAIVPSVGSH